MSAESPTLSTDQGETSLTEPMTAAELLAMGELVDVRFLEFSAGLREEPRDDLESDDVEHGMNIMVGDSEGVLEVRARFTVDTAEAEYLVVAATQFHYDAAQVRMTEALGREFAEKVGVMALYPYVREAIQSMSTRLRQEVITLPLMRTGQVSLGQPVDKAPADSPE